MNINQITGRARIGLLLALCTGGLLLSSPAAADESTGYVTDAATSVVRNSSGECWHTSSWSKDIVNAECNPAQFAAMEPTPVAEAPRRSVQRFNLASDAYFGFDKAELRPEGTAKLDELVAEMRDKREPSIQITGYTDRIGTEEYNMGLSQRRAEAVRDYLVNRGIEAEIIETAARGPKNPVVNCEGKTGNDLIRCLAPNRRTEVEFSAFEVVEEPR
ncbi:MAG: OmpA family protein [Gammaproteobacteria bacterium]